MKTVILIIALSLIACGASPQNPSEVAPSCEVDVNNISSEHDLRCTLSKGNKVVSVRRGFTVKGRLTIPDGTTIVSNDSELNLLGDIIGENITFNTIQFRGEGSLSIRNPILKNVTINELKSVVLEGKVTVADSDLETALEIDSNLLSIERSVVRDVAIIKDAKGLIRSSTFNDLKLVGTEVFVVNSSVTTLVSEANTENTKNRFVDTCISKGGNDVVGVSNRTGECSVLPTSLCEHTKDTPYAVGFDEVDRVKVGDFTGDGFDNLILVGNDEWYLYDHASDEWTIHRVVSTPPWTLGVGDFDGDKIDDIVQANGTSWLLSNKASGDWVELQKNDRGFARQHIKIADLDGDGVSDIVVPESKTARVLWSKGGTEPLAKFSKLTVPAWMVFVNALDDVPGSDVWFFLPNAKNLPAYNKNGSIKLERETDTHPYTSMLIDSLGNEPIRVSWNDGSFSITYSTNGSGRGGSGKHNYKLEFVRDKGEDGIDVVLRACGGIRPTYPSGSGFRFATYNINHGGVRPIEEIGVNIASLAADVVFLQEIDRFTKRAPVDQLAEVKKASGFKYAEFGKTNAYRGGDYGVGILSRYPIKQTGIINLAAHPDPKVWNEKHILFWAELEMPGQNEVVAVTHLINRFWWKNNADLSKTQDKQVDQIATFMKNRNPLAVFGDFNFRPAAPPFKALTATNYRDAWSTTRLGPGITYEDLSKGDPRRIDYGWMRNDTTVIGARVPKWIYSDHYPLIVEFYR